ncbi:MAG: hypothetical protein RR232_01315 [Clostridia bacterium]
METNKELLHTIYENAAIGKQTLGRLIKKSKDATFRNVMAEQFAEYQKLLCEAENLRNIFETSSVAHIPRTPIFASLYLNTALDATSSHMAEMVIQGSTMGIIDMRRQLRELSGADTAVISLGEKLLLIEENNIRQMYNYV